MTFEISENDCRYIVFALGVATARAQPESDLEAALTEIARRLIKQQEQRQAPLPSPQPPPAPPRPHEH